MKTPLFASSMSPFTHLKKLSLSAVMMLTLGLPACSLFGVYQIDLPQGTPITQTQANKVQVGMSADQVLYLLGSPALRDTLAPNRWDYIYDYTPGTDGKRSGKDPVDDASWHLIVYFNADNTVRAVQGIDSLPN